MFVDCFTNSDILKLLYEFLFKESSRVTELISRPENPIFCTGVNTDFFQFMANPKCCGRKITVSRLMSISSKEWPINSMSSAQIIVLMFTLHKIVIGTFNNFLSIRGAGPKSKQRQRNSNKFPDQGKRKGFEWNWILYSLLCPKFCYFCPGSHKMF